MGAGSDLQIYHQGSHSYIQDVGTGSLILVGNNVTMQNAAQSENMFSATQDGSVDLYYDGSRRVFTSPGGLQIDAAGSNPIITNTSSPVYANAGRELQRGGNGYCNVRFASNYGVTMSLGGISNTNTTEFSFIQDNSGNAYIRNEHTNPLRFQIGSSGLDSTNTMVMYNGGEVTKPRQPCFSGTTSMGSGNGTGGATINLIHGASSSQKFSDIGNNYNTSNGRFTCPVAGNYLVACNALVYNEKYMYFRLNGSDIGNGSVAYTNQDDYKQISAQMIVTANANDYIEINVRGSGIHYQNEHGSALFALLS